MYTVYSGSIKGFYVGDDRAAAVEALNKLVRTQGGSGCLAVNGEPKVSAYQSGPGLVRVSGKASEQVGTSALVATIDRMLGV